MNCHAAKSFQRYNPIQSFTYLPILYKSNSSPKPTSMKKIIAEFIGTLALVLFGCGAAVVSGISNSGPAGLGLLGISLAFGLAVVAMAYAIGPISAVI